jgi:hypothetical protein
MKKVGKMKRKRKPVRAKAKAKTRTKTKTRAKTKTRTKAKREPATRGVKRRAPTPKRKARRPKKRAATRRVARRPKMRVVAQKKVRAVVPPPPPAFPQATGAPAKQQLLFRMVKARASVLAAVQGMSAATAEQPLGAGKWTSREVVLHLVTRDRARLREMEAALRGIRPSWDGENAERQSRVNEEDLAPLRRFGWDEALRLLNATRQELMEAIESIPEEPAEVWADTHPLGWMFQRLPPHDLHHADQIKRWRTERGH